MAQYRTDSPPPASPGEERLFTANFLLASLVTLAVFSSFFFLLATLPVYIVWIGGSEAEVGLIIGVFATTAVVVRPFVGKAADDHGRIPFILAGIAILSICTGLYAVAGSVVLLLTLRVVHGAAWASFGTAIGTLVADLAPRNRRGAAMGYYGMFNNLAMAVGPAAGVMLMNSHGFPVLFASSAAIAVLALLLSLGLREPPRPARQRTQNWPGRGVIESSALFPSLILALTTVTYASIVSFLPIYAVRQGIDNPGLFFTVFAATLIVARGITGQLSDRYGRAAVIAPGLALAATGLWLLATATTLPSFLAVGVLYGLSFAAIQPALMAMVVDRAPPHRRGAAIGTFSSAMDLGIGVGSVAWGFAVQWIGYQGMYVASSGVALITLAVFLAGLRLRGKRSASLAQSR